MRRRSPLSRGRRRPSHRGGGYTARRTASTPRGSAAAAAARSKAWVVRVVVVGLVDDADEVLVADVPKRHVALRVAATRRTVGKQHVRHLCACAGSRATSRRAA